MQTFPSSCFQVQIYHSSFFVGMILHLRYITYSECILLTLPPFFRVFRFFWPLWGLEADWTLQNVPLGIAIDIFMCSIIFVIVRVESRSEDATNRMGLEKYPIDLLKRSKDRYFPNCGLVLSSVINIGTLTLWAALSHLGSYCLVYKPNTLMTKLTHLKSYPDSMKLLFNINYKCYNEDHILEKKVW